jgi:hypothetical protein
MKETVLTREIVETNGWDKLEVITADMLQGYTEIGPSAFEDCPVKEITLPETIKVIHNYAFCGTLLKRVTLPESIVCILGFVFANCNELEEVIFKGEKISLIGPYLFANCSQLKYLKLSKNITYCDRAFWDCPTITSKFEIQDYSKPVVAYKGFNEDMTCMNGFQYEEGETYEFEGEPKLCKCGFHACLNPLDVFGYYPLYAGNVYHEVILEGVSEARQTDSKVVAKKITIGRELTIKDMKEIFIKKVNSEEK